jgi:hypothetical protein
MIVEKYEQLMRPNLEKRKLLALKFCQDALRYYRQIKNLKKIEELETI